jgi:hypothetical protein
LLIVLVVLGDDLVAVDHAALVAAQPLARKISKIESRHHGSLATRSLQEPDQVTMEFF